MTTVYNVYYSFNLSQTAAFLASNECKSLKDFQRIWACQCSLRQFCQLLANDLTVEVASSLNYNSSSSDVEDERMMNDETSVQEVIVNNNWEAFFSKPSWLQKAKSKNCSCAMLCLKANQLCLVLSSGPFTRFSKAKPTWQENNLAMFYLQCPSMQSQ